MKKRAILAGLLIVTLVLSVAGMAACADKDLEKSGVFADGMIAVRNENGLYGYINSKGAEVLPFTYDSAGAFCGGYATVKRGADWYLIDKEGNSVAGPYKAANIINDTSYMIMQDKDLGLWGIYDLKQGKEISPCLYGNITNYENYLVCCAVTGSEGRETPVSADIFLMCNGKFAEVQCAIEDILLVEDTFAVKKTVITQDSETLTLKVYNPADGSSYEITGNTGAALDNSSEAFYKLTKEDSEGYSVDLYAGVNGVISTEGFDSVSTANGLLICQKTVDGVRKTSAFNNKGEILADSVNSSDFNMHYVNGTTYYRVTVKDAEGTVTAYKYIVNGKLYTVPVAAAAENTVVNYQFTGMVEDLSAKKTYAIFTVDTAVTAEGSETVHSYATVLYDSEGAKITLEGKRDIKQIYGDCLVAVDSVTGKYSVLKSDGSIVIAPLYDEIEVVDGGYYKIKLGSKYGVAKADGGILIDCIYNAIVI